MMKQLDNCDIHTGAVVNAMSSSRSSRLEELCVGTDLPVEILGNHLEQIKLKAVS